MAGFLVKYQYYKNGRWSGVMESKLFISMADIELAKNTLLGRNSYWEDVRILDIKAS